MKLESFFDIRREPPTAEQIDAAIQFVDKKAKKLLTILAVLFFVNAFLFVSLTRQGLPFMVLVISFLIFMVMLLFSVHLKDISLGLSRARNKSLSKLLILVKSGAQRKEEQTYIEGVLRQGRPFCRFEIETLTEAMTLRSEDQERANTAAELEAVIRARPGEQGG